MIDPRSNKSNMIAFSEAIKIPGFYRVKINRENKIETLYTALDPASTHTMSINKDSVAANSDATISLHDIRTHAVLLYRLLRNLDINGDFRHSGNCDFDWNAVCYSLHMAASVDDVYADTSLVDDSESITYCSPAAEFEKAHSESASKYMAALIFFNFVWTGYEAAIELAGDGRSIKKKTGAKGRALIAESNFQAYHFPIIDKVFYKLLRSCLLAMDNKVSKDIDVICRRPNKSIVELSSELARIVRNRIIHGAEPVPYPEDYGGYSESAEAHPCQRIYLSARLTMILIQALALMTVRNSSAPTSSPYDDDEEDIVSQTINFSLRTVHIEESTHDRSQVLFEFM